MSREATNIEQEEPLLEQGLCKNILHVLKNNCKVTQNNCFSISDAVRMFLYFLLFKKQSVGEDVQQTISAQITLAELADLSF